jgi:hypothetical protein
VKQTNLNIFYHLGIAMEALRELSTGQVFVDAVIHIISPVEWLTAFLDEIEGVPMPEARRAARKLLDKLVYFIAPPYDMQKTVTQLDMTEIINFRSIFEKELEREHRNLDVFTVLPVGLYATRPLIENAEEKFPVSVRNVLNEAIVYDIRQAGKCLAFECPTACAFHICRATESMILLYFQKLAGAPWPHHTRNWGEYIKHLNKFPHVERRITARLDEIRTLERNPYTHPEIRVEVDMCPTVFELCTGVMHLVADQIKRSQT